MTDLSRRDKFALAAMQSLVQRFGAVPNTGASAVALADATLAALDAQPEKATVHIPPMARGDSFTTGYIADRIAAGERPDYTDHTDAPRCVCDHVREDHTQRHGDAVGNTSCRLCPCTRFIEFPPAATPAREAMAQQLRAAFYGGVAMLTSWSDCTEETRQDWLRAADVALAARPAGAVDREGLGKIAYEAVRGTLVNDNSMTREFCDASVVARTQFFAIVDALHAHIPPPADECRAALERLACYVRTSVRARGAALDDLLDEAERILATTTPAADEPLAVGDAVSIEGEVTHIPPDASDAIEVRIATSGKRVLIMPADLRRVAGKGRA